MVLHCGLVQDPSKCLNIYFGKHRCDYFRLISIAKSSPGHQGSIYRHFWDRKCVCVPIGLGREGRVYLTPHLLFPSFSYCFITLSSLTSCSPCHFRLPNHPSLIPLLFPFSLYFVARANIYSTRLTFINATSSFHMLLTLLTAPSTLCQISCLSSQTLNAPHLPPETAHPSSPTPCFHWLS